MKGPYRPMPHIPQPPLAQTVTAGCAVMQAVASVPAAQHWPGVGMAPNGPDAVTSFGQVPPCLSAGQGLHPGLEPKRRSYVLYLLLRIRLRH